MASPPSSLISLFLEASSKTVLCDKWICGDDLCVAISSLFSLEKDVFTIPKFNKALNTQEGRIIKCQIDNTIQSDLLPDHIGIFRSIYRPKKRKNIKSKGTVYGFYFVSKKGSAPPTYSDPWYNHIIDFTDLARLVLNYTESYSTKNTDE